MNLLDEIRKQGQDPASPHKLMKAIARAPLNVAGNMGSALYDSMQRLTHPQNGDPFLDREQSVEDAFNVASMAMVGGMPFAPRGAGTLASGPKVPANIRKALEQGYRMDEQLYHGTNSLDDFERFSTIAERSEGRRTGGKGSISLSNDPKFASGYSTPHMSDEEMARITSQYYPASPPAGPRVMPVVTRGNLWDYTNPDHINLALSHLENKGSFVPNSYNGMAPESSTKAWYKQQLEDARWPIIEGDLGRDFFKENNFTGARVMERNVPNVIMYDPSAIRSPWAKFNKKDKNSSNLLASGLLGALGLSNLQQEEIK